MKFIMIIEGNEYSIEIIDESHVLLNGQLREVDFVSIYGQPVYSLIVDGKSYEASVYPDEDDWQVLLLGRLYQVRVDNELDMRLRTSGGRPINESAEYHLKAPMPGMIVAISITEDQLVEKGQVLVILESMKMQNEIKSPRAGKVHRIRVKTGEVVEQRQTLLSVI